MQRDGATWMAFLAVTFCIVGLAGVFASYAAPIPLERALARDATLDEALAAGDSKAALDPLRDRLADSAALVIDGTGPLPARVAAARAAMHATLAQDAAATGTQLRLLIVVVTVAAAGFGMILLGSAARSR